MLEWGGFPGDTGTCRIAWRGWNVMNDWNVWNTMNDWNVLEDLECLERSCGWSAWNVFGAHGWISRRSPCLLCVEFLVVKYSKSSLSSVCRIGFWMENSLYVVCGWWLGTLVELELKNPVGLLHVE